MRYGWVQTNILDMREKPTFFSERMNQLLFGAVVEIKREKSGFALVTNADNYTGWVLKKGLREISADSDVKTLHRHSYIVNRATVKLYSDSSATSQTDPFTLYYGTRLSGKLVGNDLLMIQGA